MAEKKNALTQYSMEELLRLEKASRLVSLRYENSSRNYDGSVRCDGNDVYVKKFQKYNSYHLNILDEMERRLDNEMV